MARNKIKAKSTKKGTTKATGRDYSKEKAYQKKKTKYRSELNKEARKKGVYGKRYKQGKDLCHVDSKGKHAKGSSSKSGGKMKLCSRSKNRAQPRKNMGKSKKGKK